MCGTPREADLADLEGRVLSTAQDAGQQLSLACLSAAAVGQLGQHAGDSCVGLIV